MYRRSDRHGALAPRLPSPRSDLARYRRRAIFFRDRVLLLVERNLVPASPLPGQRGTPCRGAVGGLAVGTLAELGLPCHLCGAEPARLRGQRCLLEGCPSHVARGHGLPVVCALAGAAL